MGKCKDCAEVIPEDCEPCDFEIPASCVDVDSLECLDIDENDLQSVLDEICSFFEGGFTGTVSNPTSITVINGVITDVS